MHNPELNLIDVILAYLLGLPLRKLDRSRTRTDSQVGMLEALQYISLGEKVFPNFFVPGTPWG